MAIVSGREAGHGQNIGFHPPSASPDRGIGVNTHKKVCVPARRLFHSLVQTQVTITLAGEVDLEPRIGHVDPHPPRNVENHGFLLDSAPSPGAAVAPTVAGIQHHAAAAQPLQVSIAPQERIQRPAGIRVVERMAPSGPVQRRIEPDPYAVEGQFAAVFPEE